MTLAFWQLIPSVMAQQLNNPPAMRDPQAMQFQLLSQEDPLLEGMATYSGILWYSLGNPMVRGA